MEYQDIDLLNQEFTNGDFDLVENVDTLNQDENIIINIGKGQCPKDVLLGVGIAKYLNAPISMLDLSYVIRTELSKDNIRVTSVKVDADSAINIDSERLN